MCDSPTPLAEFLWKCAKLIRMQLSFAWIGLVTLLMTGSLACGDDSSSTPENKFNEIRKTCVAQKKGQAMCGCLVKVLRSKFTGGQFSEQQLGDALMVTKNMKPNAEEV